jgi:hypothetical protein
VAGGRGKTLEAEREGVSGERFDSVRALFEVLRFPWAGSGFGSGAVAKFFLFRDEITIGPDQGVFGSTGSFFSHQGEEKEKGLFSCLPIRKWFPASHVFKTVQSLYEEAFDYVVSAEPTCSRSCREKRHDKSSCTSVKISWEEFGHRWLNRATYLHRSALTAKSCVTIFPI